VIGRRVEAIAGLDRVTVMCDGRAVAGHERSWAWHQTITDPGHLQAARALRAHRSGALRPVTEPDVEQRALAVYDQLAGGQRVA
jgi:hypothetical protein